MNNTCAQRLTYLNERRTFALESTMEISAIDEEINKLAVSWAAMNRYPLARVWRPHVGQITFYTPGLEQPKEIFLWSKHLNSKSSDYDHVFTYEQCEGVLRLLHRRFDHRIRRLHKLQDENVRRKHFYISRVFSFLVVIHEKMVRRNKVMQQNNWIDDTEFKETEEIEYIESTAVAPIEVFEDALVLTAHDPIPEDVIVEDAIVIPAISCLPITEEEEVNIDELEIDDSRVLPILSEKFMKRVAEVQKMLAPIHDLSCICDACVIKFCMHSKFSSSMYAKDYEKITIDAHVTVAEPQMLEEELVESMANCSIKPPASLKGKELAKIVNMLRQMESMLIRMQDKVYKFCHRGRFSYQKTFDMYLYHAQSRALRQAYIEWTRGLSVFAIPDLQKVITNIPIPYGYVEMVNYSYKKTKTTVRKLLDQGYNKILERICKMNNVYYTLNQIWSLPFDHNRVMENFELQGDEEKTEVKAKTPLKSESKAPAKADGKTKTSATKKPKVYKNVKKGNVKGTIKKVDKAVTEGEQKTNIVLADERTVQKEKLKKAVTAPKDSNAEKNNDMDRIWKRWMMISRLTWNASTPSTEDLATYILPGAYFNFKSKTADKVCQPMTVNNMISQYGFTRFDMLVRVQINSNKFQNGLLLIYWEPFMFKERDGYPTDASYVNFPHTWINAKESNSVELEIPWQNMRDYFPVYWDAHTEYNYWGKLHIRPWNALKTGGTTSPAATITVYMAMKNWEVHQQVAPKPAESITFTTNIMKPDFPNYKQVEQIWPEPRMVGYSTTVQPEARVVAQPQMEEVAASFLPDLGQFAMEQLAHALSRVVNDKPLAPGPAPPTKIEVLPSTAPGDGAAVGTTLGLTTKRQTPMRKEFLDTVAPVNYRELLAMESFVKGFQWRLSDSENTTIGEWNVAPGICGSYVNKDYTVGCSGEKWEQAPNDPTSDFEFREYAKDYTMAGTEMSPTMLGYLAKMHLWWRGPLKFRLQVVKTDMHTGRLGIKYEPSGGTIDNETECSKISKPMIVWDINECDELIFVAEYASAQPFLSTLYEGLTYGHAESDLVGEYACGHVEVFVINALKASTGVSTTVDINLFISAAPGFEFSGLQDLSSIMAIGKYPLSQISNITTNKGGKPQFVLEMLTLQLFNMGFRSPNVEPTKILEHNGAKWKYSSDGEWSAAFANRLVNGLKTATMNILTLRAQVTKDSIVQRFRNEIDHEPFVLEYVPEIASSYEKSKNYLFSRYKLEKACGFWDVVPYSMKITILKWLPVVYMQTHAAYIQSVPSDEGMPLAVCTGKKDEPNWWDMHNYFLSFLPKKKGVKDITYAEPQGDEVEGLENKPTPDKGINPFADGTTVPMASVKDLNGEDFNDMYKIMRRFYCFKKFLTPAFRPGGTSFTPMEKTLLMMNPEEISTMYWDIKIPVTPSVDFGYPGITPGYVVKPPAIPKFITSPDQLVKFGAKWGVDTNLTPITFLSEIFTFWRGSMRYMIFLPEDLISHAFIIHEPQDYQPQGIDIQCESKVLQRVSYGTCIYKKNVMGGLTVEVPWQQKYSRLVISRNSNTAITQNGTLHIYVPIIRPGGQFRVEPLQKDVIKDPLGRVKVVCFHALGDDTEMLIPRAAPNLWIWRYFSENRASDGWEDGNYETIVPTSLGQIPIPWEAKHSGVSRRLIPYVDGNLSNQPSEVFDQTIPLADWLPLKTFDNWEGKDLNASLTRLRDASWDTRPVKQEKATAMLAIEQQGLEEGEEQTMPKQVLEADEFSFNVPEQTYQQFMGYLNDKTATPGGDVVDAPTRKLGMNNILTGLAHAMVDVPTAISSFKELLEKMSKTWSITDQAASVWKTAGDTVKVVGAKIETGVNVAWDATRLGVIAYAIYNFLNAESMQGKLMSLSSAALAMGLSYETVKRTFDWLISSVTGLFGESKGQNSQIEPQGIVPETWKEFIASNHQVLQLVASAIGAFAVFSFTPSLDSMTGKVSNFASNMMTKLKNFTIVGSAFKTLDWLFKWIGGCFKSAFEWACDLATGGMFTKSLLSDKYPKILDWLSKIEMYSQDHNLIKTAWDPEERYKIWHLMDEGKIHAEAITKQEQFLANYIRSGLEKLNKVNDKVINFRTSVPVRTDPFCIWIYGGPGVGKSACANQIINFVCDHLGLPETNRVYSRNESDDYWSGYIGQPCVIMDDACQFRESPGVNDMIKMKSNVEYQLNMADLQDKGRKFNSKLIVCTSNQDYPTMEDMTCSLALWRRRNILVQAELIDLNKGPGIANMRFKILNPVRKGIHYGVKSLSELMAMCAMRAKHYLKEQEALVFSNLQGRRIPYNVGSETDKKLTGHIVESITEAARYIAIGHVPPAAVLEVIEKFDVKDWDAAAVKTHGTSEAIRAVMMSCTRKAKESGKQFSEAVLSHMIRVAGPLAQQQDPIPQMAIEDGDNYIPLKQQADECLETTSRAYECAMMYQEDNEPVVKWFHVKNDQEIEEFVRIHYPHVSDRAQIVEDYKKIFEAVHTPDRSSTYSATTILGDEKYTKYFTKNGEGDWELSIPMSKTADELTEEELDVMGLWETQFGYLEKRVRNDLLDSILVPKGGVTTPLKTTRWFELIRAWCGRKIDAVRQYFSEHTWIVKTLKIGGMLTGFFLGWRLLKLVCGEWMDKIENKLLYMFGLAAATKPARYVGEKYTQGKHYVLNSSIYNKIYEQLYGKEDHPVPESLEVAGVMKEMEKLIPSAVAAATLKSRKMPNAYYSGDGKTTVLSVVPQGTNDITSANVQEASSNNLVRIIITHNGRSRKMGAFFYKFRYLVGPLHLFDSLDDGDGMAIIFQNNGKENICYDVFEKSRFTQIGSIDAGMFRCSKFIPTSRDISKHFITEEMNTALGSTDAVLNVRSETGELIKWMTRATGKTQIDYQGTESLKEYDLRKNFAWVYAAGTQRGDCGALLFAVNPSLQKKVLGMHIAGMANHEAGFSVCLTYEMMEKAVEAVCDGSDIIKEAVQQCYLEPEVDVETRFPSGNFNIIGTLKPQYRNRLPFKTEIKKSPIHGLVREATSSPAILTVRDSRWNFEGSPLMNAISKYGEAVIPFRESDVKYVMDDVANDWYNWRISMEPRVLSDWEAIYGNEYIRFCDRMNMASSPGFPYISWRDKGKGKEWLYDIEAEDGISNQEYREIYNQREEKAKKGIRSPHLWTTCLKDERRPLAKIDLGKTRAFVIPSADFTQLFRKYFLSFCVNFYSNYGMFSSAVGCDPYSGDWTLLWRRLKEVSTVGFGIDFQNFDGLTNPDMAFHLVARINKWYKENDKNWKPEDDIVRVTLMEDCMQSDMIVGKSVLTKFNGNPSGNPMTTVLNTCIQEGYVKLSWKEIMRLLSLHWSLEVFNTHVRMILYGDDGVISINPKLTEVFNLKTVSAILACHGLVCTGEDKFAEQYTVRPLTDCTFLKNGFTKMQKRNIMLAPIAVDTIYELTNWVKKSPDDFEQLRVNLQDALRFAFHHGRHFYDQFKDAVNVALFKRNSQG